MTALWSRPARRSPGAVLGAAVACAAFALPCLLAGPAGASARRTTTAALPPAKAVARAAASVQRANAFVLVGHLDEAKSTLAFQVASSAHGTAAKGELVSRSARLGFVGRLDFVERRGAVFLRAGVPFWRAQLSRKGTTFPAAERGKVARKLAHGWVRVTGTAARKVRSSLGPLTSPATFVRTLVSNRSLGHLRRGKLTSFRHKSALSIGSAKGAVLYVSAKGAPRLLGLVTRAGTGKGTIVLAYPRAVAIAKPPRARALHQLVTLALR